MGNIERQINWTQESENPDAVIVYDKEASHFGAKEATSPDFAKANADGNETHENEDLTSVNFDNLPNENLMKILNLVFAIPGAQLYGYENQKQVS